MLLNWPGLSGGYARVVVTHVRETRLTNIFSNIIIGLSMLFLPYVLPYVPKVIYTDMVADSGQLPPD